MKEVKSEELVKQWFDCWTSGRFMELPVTEDFCHISPFGQIDGKKAYLELVEANKDKFLGYRFEIHDALYNSDNACVRYTTKQGEDFTLDVSEWYYFKNGLIAKIVAYYHIGEIKDDRKIDDYN